MRAAADCPAAVARHGRWRFAPTALTTAVCLVICPGLFPFVNFSVAGGKQTPLAVLRERTGQSIAVNIDAENQELFKDQLTASENKLKSFLAQAGRRGDWSEVSRLWGRYSGTAVTVHRAAMQAAFHCARYEDAACIYDKLVNLPGFVPDPVSSGRGMKKYSVNWAAEWKFQSFGLKLLRKT